MQAALAIRSASSFPMMSSCLSGEIQRACLSPSSAPVASCCRSELPSVKRFRVGTVSTLLVKTFLTDNRSEKAAGGHLPGRGRQHVRQHASSCERLLHYILNRIINILTLIKGFSMHNLAEGLPGSNCCVPSTYSCSKSASPAVLRSLAEL